MVAIRPTLLAALLLWTIASLLPCRLQAEDTQIRARPSESVLAEGNKVLARVNAETKSSVQEPNAWPWSGQYYAGDGLGFNLQLAIAPKAGVVYWSQGCLGLYEVNYGSFREKDGYIHLTFDEQVIENTGTDEGLHPVLIPVRWGDRRYLIPENEMIDFCNHVNSKSQGVSRSARFLRHVDDGKKKSRGIPKVPPRYRGYMLKEPIEAEIAWVGKMAIVERDDIWPPGKYRVTDVRVNRGKADGLLPGMEMYCSELPDLRILDASASSSRAEVSEWLLEEDVGTENEPPAVEPQVRTGLRYSTRSPSSEITGSEKE